MGFSMNFSREELSGKPPVPAGWYQFKFNGFKPKFSNLKPGETEPSSLNLNAELEIINHPDYTGRKVFVGLNSKFFPAWFDFVYACGVEMEVVQDEFTGTTKENLTIPGVFENADTSPLDASNWKYLGPLTNKTLEAELAETPAEGNYRAKNEVRQFKCAIPGCTARHSTNLIFNKKS